MKLGLQIPDFNWPGGDAAIGSTFARVVRDADDAGFDSLWVMDHFFQIPGIGAAEEPMLEGWSALAFAAGLTSRVTLGLMVGGIHYRQAGLWAKLATTLDVLSGGRAWLGIGAAWNEQESKALGFPMPPLGQRFEMLEETLQIVHEMWEGDRGTGRPFRGRHYQLERMLNSPQAVRRPHPPIMIGGGGERKTLRLVAQYADATNVFGGPDMLRHKYAVLRERCDEVGRSWDEIERSNLNSFRVAGGGGGEGVSPAEMVDRIGAWHDAGSQHVIFSVRNVAEPGILELIGRDVVPQVHGMDR
ncbi:MAG TPA: LLM class F420-dependent oxidoreductase [Candidatus Acidoferrales bacterium]|nr:LLM class F420-dependent oxidoreductase [Candidatus Acidoferrales bacterium]